MTFKQRTSRKIRGYPADFYANRPFNGSYSMNIENLQHPELKISGTFRSVPLENQFQASQHKFNMRRMIVICTLTSILYFLAFVNDKTSLGVSREFQILFFLRLTVMLLGLSAAYIAWKPKLFRHLAWTMMVYMTSIGFVESIELFFKFNNLTGIFIPTTIFIVLMYYLFIPLRFFVSFIPAMFMSVSYTLTLVYFTDAPSSYYSTIAMFFMVANIYGTYHTVLYNRMRRKEFYALVGQRKLNEELEKEIAIRRLAEEKLLKMSTIDELTGIYNRRYFMEALDKDIKRSNRYGTPLSLMMVDADYFKNINDTHGHDAGDLALKKLAEIMATTLRESDIFARFGGEEFVALLSGADMKKACEVAERLRINTCDTTLRFPNSTAQMTVSIGIASLTDNCNSSETFIKAADQALYLAKKRGRNRVCTVYDLGRTDWHP